MSVPSQKGQLEECVSCIFYSKKLIKYPCELSHKLIRQSIRKTKCIQWMEK